MSKLLDLLGRVYHMTLFMVVKVVHNFYFYDLVVPDKEEGGGS